MNERERIIAILNEAHLEYYSHMDFTKTYIEAVADHLLANGVTVSEEVEELKADNQRLCEMWAKAVSDLSKAEASLIEAQRWIPVTERLPEDDLPQGTKRKMIRCLVYTNKGTVKPCVRQRWEHFNGEMQPWMWSKDLFATPTHWVPLPEPPKEEE